MANKADRFYFENLISASEFGCKAANYLQECLDNFNADNIKQMLDTMHGYEHSADKVKHAMSEALAKAFVTPIDREDLAEISHNVDEVSDTVEEILQSLYINDITVILPEAKEFCSKIVNCCLGVKEMLGEFINFKKPAKLLALIVNINDLEEECDKLYIHAVKNIKSHTSDVLEIISWREIYDCMENCADACESVADAIGTIIMKNS